MADLFLDDFVASNGTTLASRGFVVAASGSNTATVQGNQAQFLSTANGDWLNVTRNLTLTDGGIEMPVRVGSGSGNKFFALAIRATVDVDGYFTGGYALGLDIGSRTATLYRMDTWATITTVANFTPVDQSTLFTIRFEAEGTTIRAKSWAGTGADPSPGTWPINGTDSLFASGRTGVALEGFASGSRAWFADSWRTYDFTAPTPLEAGGIEFEVTADGSDTLHQGGTHYDDFGGALLTIEASGADTRGLTDAGGVTFEVSTSGFDGLSYAQETGNTTFEIVASGSDSLTPAGDHFDDSGGASFVIVTSGSDALAVLEAGDITFQIVVSGTDLFDPYLEFGGIEFTIDGAGVDTTHGDEVGVTSFEVTADGVDTHGHTETGAASFTVSAAGVDTHRMADAGVVEVEIDGSGTDTTTGVETGDITFSLEASGVDSIGMYDLGVTTFTIDGSGLDGFVGVDSGRVTIVFSTFGTDHASFDVTPLPRLSLVIPRVNELQWRALVDWANDLVAELESRFADD